MPLAVAIGYGLLSAMASALGVNKIHMYKNLKSK